MKEFPIVDFFLLKMEGQQYGKKLVGLRRIQESAKGNPLNFGVVEMNVGDIRKSASQVTHLDAIHNPIPDSYSHSLVINFPPINHEDFIEVQYGLAKISKWCLFPNPS